MSEDKLGRVRRSQVIMTHGPGAIVDFRSPAGAPISVVSAGLEGWDEFAAPQGLQNPQRVTEPRLQAKLNKKGFRLPPATEEPAPGREADPNRPMLPASRFPEWLTCPGCNLLQPIGRWTERPGDPAPICRRCSDEQGERVHVVPARFVLACPNGHLDEFPWLDWIPHADSCRRDRALKLEGVSAGLKGLRLSCTACAQSRSMDGAFSPQALRDLHIRCSGRRPWLQDHQHRCQETPVAVQRGASNTYFPAFESALTIPPWADDLQTRLSEFWPHLVSATTPGDLDRIVELLVYPTWEDATIALEDLQATIRERMSHLNADVVDNLRFDEYRHLSSQTDSNDEASELTLKPQVVPAGLKTHLGRLTQVVRLREVRALYGFSRIHPPSGGFGSASIAQLSRSPKHWLPAVEVRGEGIFITLQPDLLAQWETRPTVQQRAAALDQRNRQELNDRLGDDAAPEFEISPRRVLLHTLAHALMAELALECGYSSSALRERLYVEEREPGMGGLLIYTAAPDADGTLGGLVREGRPDRFEPLIRAAVERSRWCASDPLCMSGVASLSDGLNGAACHACAMAPETACEHFNRFLDRALLIGLPGDERLPEHERVGFFDALTRGED